MSYKFVDLTDEAIQPEKIDVYSLPEIHISDALKGQLKLLFEVEGGFVKLYDTSAIIQTGSNYVFFSYHWLYLAVLCKKYVEALKPYYVFFEEKIRSNPDALKAIAQEKYNEPVLLELLPDDTDRERVCKFIAGGSDFRPGKSLINGDDGSRVRTSKDIVGSCALKKIAVPDASSAYLGYLVYYLGENPDVYALLEAEILAQLGEENSTEYHTSTKIATNKILYGVPGVGKSYYIEHTEGVTEAFSRRVVFHPDYTYSDFVGQILPKVDTEGKLKYEFTPGPLAEILKLAHETPASHWYLVIEEINRGNAPAIFGEIFQLLDRDDNGVSEYGINNADIARYVYGNGHESDKIRIPGNLSLVATMNTADQNVFTLDTAFQRRWEMKHIPNEIDKCKYGDTKVVKTDVTWGDFASTVNETLIGDNDSMIVSEDKRLGAYFVKESELGDAHKFSEKALKYLWDDAAKMDRTRIFDENIKSLDQLIEEFAREPYSESLQRVLNNNIYNKMIAKKKKQDEAAGENHADDLTGVSEGVSIGLESADTDTEADYVSRGVANSRPEYSINR